LRTPTADKIPVGVRKRGNDFTIHIVGARWLFTFEVFNYSLEKTSNRVIDAKIDE
jgi:hypothetical protein